MVILTIGNFIMMYCQTGRYIPNYIGYIKLEVSESASADHHDKKSVPAAKIPIGASLKLQLLGKSRDCNDGGETCVCRRLPGAES